MQQEVKRLLNELQTNRQVETQSQKNQPYPNQTLTSVKERAHQHIPNQVATTQNLIGDYQRPPEIHERAERQDYRCGNEST